MVINVAIDHLSVFLLFRREGTADVKRRPTLGIHQVIIL